MKHSEVHFSLDGLFLRFALPILFDTAEDCPSWLQHNLIKKPTGRRVFCLAQKQKDTWTFLTKENICLAQKQKDTSMFLAQESLSRSGDTEKNRKEFSF